MSINKRFKFMTLRGAPEAVIAVAEQSEELPFRETAIFDQLVAERGNPLRTGA